MVAKRIGKSFFVGINPLNEVFLFQVVGKGKNRGVRTTDFLGRKSFIKDKIIFTEDAKRKFTKSQRNRFQNISERVGRKVKEVI